MPATTPAIIRPWAPWRRDAGISSLLVLGDSPGIVTDRDLRGRVLAEGRGADTRVGDVTTRPLRTIAASATLLETLVFMLEHRVHRAGRARSARANRHPAQPGAA